MYKGLFITLWLIAALVGLWFWRSHQNKAFVESKVAQLEHLQNENFTFKHDKIESGGFPFTNTVTVRYPRFTFKDANGEEAVEWFLDGDLIFGSNLQASQFWIKTKGTQYLLNHNLDNDAKGTDEWISTGEHTLTYTPSDYDFIGGIPKSISEGNVKTILRDIAHKGEISGKDITIKGYFFSDPITMTEAVTVEKPIEFTRIPEYHGAWQINKKDKGLDQFVYRFDLTSENALVEHLNTNNESLPDLGPVKTAFEGQIVYDPELPLDEPFRIIESLQKKPFVFEVTKLNSSDKYDYSNLNFALKSNPLESGKFTLQFILNGDSKSSKEAYEVASFQLRRFLETAQDQFKDLPPGVAAKLPKLSQDIFPRFYELGKVITKVDLNLDMGGGIIPFMVNHLDLKNLNWESELYGFKINADFGGPMEGFLGKANVTLLNFRHLFESLASYYNSSHTSFEKAFGKEQVNSVARQVPPKAVEKLISFLRQVSNEPSGNSKDITITITHSSDGVKVGTLELEQFLKESDALFRELSEAVVPPRAPEPAAAPAPVAPKISLPEAEPALK